MTKIIAFHLPQFHCIPENDEWWGKGFTEWTNTKKCSPVFKGHNQPREPLNDNYYNMLDYETRKWQSDLAKEYGIYGFCYYHYWFNGKLLLEKPLEMLLEDTKIEMPFCLCWANEPWTRSWDGESREILINQEYGDESNWDKHFKYLINFFRDDRYIKIENRPMFVLYRTESIPNCEKMINYWDNKCKENGFEGIHIVEEMNSFQKESKCYNSKAIIEFEPMYTVANDLSLGVKIKRKYNQLQKNILKIENNMYYSYDYIWNRILKRKRIINDKKMYLGAFVDWDNSARKKKGAVIFKGSTPDKYKYYLTKQLEIAQKMETDFLFINAWNEWAEGTYLEPDKKNQYKYLESTREALNNYKSPK